MRSPDTAQATEAPANPSPSLERDPLARIEAAFELRMLELSGESAGADPYNRARNTRQDAWGKGRPR